MRTDRRHFFRHATAGSLVLASQFSRRAQVLAKAITTKMPIIDTHQHLWDLSKLKLPWLDNVPEILKRSYVTEDYLQATDGLGLVQAVYMEVDVAANQLTKEAEHVLQLCQSDNHPTSGAVIGSRPEDDGFANYIQKYTGNVYVKGVRRVLHVPEAPPGFCLQDKFVASIRLLGELGKSFDLCMRPGELGDAVSLVDRCKSTRFVLDHCGNADPKAFLPGAAPSHDVEEWRRRIGDLAKRKNVICKISGIAASAPEQWQPEVLAPIINHCLEEFGPDRVVFGGDWPVCLLGSSYEKWVTSLKEIVSGRPDGEQKKLLHDNAARFYGLPT